MLFLQQLIGPRVLPPRRLVVLAIFVAVAISIASADNGLASVGIGVLAAFPLYLLGLTTGSWTVLLLPLATAPAFIADPTASVGDFVASTLVGGCAAGALGVSLRRLRPGARVLRREWSFAALATMIGALAWSFNVWGARHPSPVLVLLIAGAAAAASAPRDRDTRRRATRVTLVLVSLPLIAYGLFELLILIASFGCPPHAYECPV